MLGVLSKTLATIATYPLQTAQSVLRSMMGSAWRETARKQAEAKENPSSSAPLQFVAENSEPTKNADDKPLDGSTALTFQQQSHVQKKNSKNGWPSLETASHTNTNTKHHGQHSHAHRHKKRSPAGQKGMELAEAIGAIAEAIQATTAYDIASCTATRLVVRPRNGSLKM